MIRSISRIGHSFKPKVFFRNNFSTLSQQVNTSNVTAATAPSNIVSVKAYYIARGINILAFQSSSLSTGSKQYFQPKFVTMAVDEATNKYISIFNYGSVVFFNIPEASHIDHLRRIRESAVIAPIAEGVQHTEDYRIVINENLDKPSVIRSEHLNIRQLDRNNIVIVGTLMAQTVALDYCEVVVNGLVSSFMSINVKIEETGNFNQLNSKSLYQLVAKNNTVIHNVLSKLGIFEGSDAAWENADYSDTWDNIRKDFEIENRFKDLSMKMEIIRENTRFFLEMLHNQKSTKLEWTIIILIAAEIVIGVAGLVPHYIN